MIKRVMLLPGQGTQFVGIVNDFSSYKWSKDLLTRVDEALDFPVLLTQLTKLMTEGPAEQLNLTEYAQPAIMVSSIVRL